MKFYIKSVFLFSLFIFHFISAQKIVIHGIVKNPADQSVVINFPFGGKYFNANNKSVNADANGNYTIELPDVEGFATVTNHFTSAKLFLEKGKTYNVNFENEKANIIASNLPLQNIVAQLELFTPARELLTDEGMKLKTSVEKVAYYTKKEQEKIEIISKAKASGEITESQYNLFKTMLDIQKRDFISTDIYFTYRANYEGEPQKLQDFNKEFLSVWEQQFSGLKTITDLTKSPTALAFLQRYDGLNDVKKLGYLNFKDKKQSENLNLIKSLITASQFENIWANAIYNAQGSNRFEKEWISNFADFNKIYPKNKYSVLLKPSINKIVEYHQNLEKAEIYYVNNYSKINSFKELFSSPFAKNKVIYVDLWATWCGPCREELQFSKENHKILENLGVLPLYLSIDNDKADVQWKKMAKSLNLTGLHMRSNSVFGKEIGQYIAKTGIPRYLIVKNGEVVEWNAKRPSDKQELFNQLKQYIN